MRTILIGMAVAAALAVTGSGCEKREPASGGRRQVSATTGIATNIVRRVAGSDASVRQLIPEGQDPHEAQLSPKDRAGLERSDLVVAFGADLEAGIHLGDAPRFEISRHAGRLRRFSGGTIDPHVWMDPQRIARAVPALAAALGRVDPAGRDAYRRRAATYASSLERLDREIRRTLATVPPRRRLLVTQHETLGYFGNRYGFRTDSILGAGTGAEASAEQLRHLSERVRRARIPAVFGQRSEGSPLLERLADAAGVRVVDDLEIEALAPGHSYVGALRRDARIIARALGTRSE